MQPVTLVIPGQFWDSQIYRGRLYLFGRDGSIRTLDWDRLIGTLVLPARLRLAAECAFCRSDYLYGSNWTLFFSDPEIKELVTSKFETLAKKKIIISEAQLQQCERGRQDNPFSFPHTDSLIYWRNMFVVGDEGVWRATCDPGRTRHPVSSRPRRHWDCPTISVAAAYRSLALAAGPEGLWELDVHHFGLSSDDSGTLSRVADRGCDACEFMFHSVYGSSYEGGGFLAEFEREGSWATGEPIQRTLSRVLSGREIFGGGEGYSWGTRDKIYLAHRGSVRIARYRPFRDDDHIEIIGDIRIQEWKGDFVSGGVATFGAILEYDNAIVVIPSEGSPVTLRGEPVRWRVFPGSRHYQNHLHTIYNDELRVQSFNQDYFVDQRAKLFGTGAVFANEFNTRRHPTESLFG